MITPPFSCFPFTALVGLDNLKLALQLAAIDRRLSVVVRGDKGAGKSTAARGLAALLDSQAPFVTLPIGATEDRLLGGLDVEKALSGEPMLKRGLLAEANGGVLYVDEVNLLPDHLADTLLDAVASGVHILERDGLSASQPADFVLLGSMNPEEGALRPQLLDRFALAADVQAPTDIELRCEVLERRLAFDRDPAAFAVAWAEAQLSVAGEPGVGQGETHQRAAPSGGAAIRSHACRRTRRQIVARGSRRRPRQSRACRARRIGCRLRGARRRGPSAGAGPPRRLRHVGRPHSHLRPSVRQSSPGKERRHHRMTARSNACSRPLRSKRRVSLSIIPEAAQARHLVSPGPHRSRRHYPSLRQAGRAGHSAIASPCRDSYRSGSTHDR